MNVEYVKKDKVTVDVKPPFVPGDVVQFLNCARQVCLEKVSGVRLECVTDEGLAEWKLTGPNFDFLVYVPVNPDPDALTDEQKFKIRERCATKNWFLKKYS